MLTETKKHSENGCKIPSRDILLADAAFGQGFHQTLRPLNEKGFFNNIYSIGDNAGIVKIPKNIPYLGAPTNEQLQEESLLLKKYEIPCPETTVVETPYDTGLIASQFVPEFRPLTTSALINNYDLRMQLKEILEKNRDLLRHDGCSLDLMGFDTAYKYLLNYHQPLERYIKNHNQIPEIQLSSNLVIYDNKLIQLDSGMLWLFPTPSVKSRYLLPHNLSYAFTNHMVFGAVEKYLLN